VRFVDHQILTPTPGTGRTVFAILHPVVLDDAAPVSVYVRGVPVPVGGYEITSDIESGDGNILTLVDAPSAGDLVTLSGFCRDPAP